ncbi:MAG: class I SAM-dependent methyltransferase [Candidatus Pacearchaeota archaeon]|jgi:SAM-dependent methyltransferase
MNARGFQDLVFMNGLFFDRIMPNIGNLHLDFGCGDGKGSLVQAKFCKNSFVIGYDSDLEKIQLANKEQKVSSLTNVSFQDSLREFIFGYSDENSECQYANIFDSATANFVFHENPLIIKEIHPYLKRDGKIIVLDYNLKGISKREFYKKFCLDNERKIMKLEGFDECYKKHTKFDITDCIGFGNSARFNTINTALSEKYFLWVGQKN